MATGRTLEVVVVAGLLCVASVAGIALYFLYGGSGSTETSCGPTQCATTRTLYTSTTFTTSATDTVVVSSTLLETTTVTYQITSTVTTTTTSTYQGGSGTLPRLGFWLQEGDIIGVYSPSAFFNAMFMTPPFPSSLEVMVFAIQQDEVNGNGCSANTPYVSSSIDYWSQVAQMADSYPNIRLIFEISFDPSSGGSGTYGLTCFDTIVQALGQYPSVYGMGVEGEYTPVSKGMTEAEMQTAMSDVTATGRLFINYYPPVPVPSGGYYIRHTNFPGGDAGGYDQVGTLGVYDSQTVGLDSGYYSGFPFPGNVTCPIGPAAMSNVTEGWNQCVVSTELSTAVNFSPSSARQFLEFVAGYSSSGNFVGVSGKTTSQLWDNPTLRNWIWEDPNYYGKFVLSY